MRVVRKLLRDILLILFSIDHFGVKLGIVTHAFKIDKKPTYFIYTNIILTKRSIYACKVWKPGEVTLSSLKILQKLYVSCLDTPRNVSIISQYFIHE